MKLQAVQNEAKITGADIVLKILQQNDVQHVFGYPGGAIMPIYDAIYDSDIKHYLCRHEQGAAFSALGYARASGDVGVCMATSGPGATNLITGLADAMADSIPVVAITGQVGTQAMGSDAFQEVDILGLSIACTKHSFQVKQVDDLAKCLQQAILIAQSDRPGPVLIDIPKDVQLALLEHSVESISPETPSISDIYLKEADEAKFLIAQSKQPILYVGGGVGMADAVADLRDFMTITGIPSVSTLKGLGSVDPSNKYYLGMLGMHGTKAANIAVQRSDLLIAIGARFDDRVTGKLVEFAPNAKVIHLDIDPAEINKRRTADVALLGNLKNYLPLLSQPLAIGEWKNLCQQLKAQYQFDYQHPSEKIYAPKLLNELSQKISSNTIITTDVGQHQMWVVQHMQFNHPNNFISSGSLGTMGFGLPTAIGAQISRSNDPVIAISGDGSFMMNVQELTTIKRFQLPIKILLIDNNKLGMVRQWQQLFFDQRYSETDLSDNPDFVMLANAFDIKAKCITQKSQVNDAVNEMLNHDGAYLLQVKIDTLENVWPLVPPETANDKMIDSISDYTNK